LSNARGRGVKIPSNRHGTTSDDRCKRSRSPAAVDARVVSARSKHQPLSPFRQNATVTHFDTSGIEGSTGLLKTIFDRYRDVLWRISGSCLRSASHLTLGSTAGVFWLSFSESI
jgi:hypothetical protein